MSQSPEAPAPSLYESYREQERARKRLFDEAMRPNKEVLFDALAAAEVRSVTVQFDGYADSGQIEEIEIDAAKPHIALLDAMIRIVRPLPDGLGVERFAMTIREALEYFAFEFLRETHEGWENNDGAYGDFLFDVGARTIRLAFNERITESEYYEYVF
jgi:hypothetical protein